jgi:hypothetical protein
MKNETFTLEEITFVRNVFASQTVNPMAPNAIEAIERIQRIVKKMETLKEQSNGKPDRSVQD